MPITTCVFDAYGTLFDVAAAARIAAQEPAHHQLATVWEKLAVDWRNKQLQYSWLRAVADAHTDFWQVTCEALDWAMEAAQLDDPALRERLLALYFELSAYPEVPEMMASLKAAGLNTAILSNGSPDMLEGAVNSAGLDGLLDASLSVQDVGIFKPHKSVYQLVLDRFQCTREQVLFVSSNGWDAAAASGFGFICVWVNRAREPMDRLPWKPAHTMHDLSGIPGLAGTIT